jgi:predicted lipoprotein with Yx(FWY)xxD motif
MLTNNRSNAASAAPRTWLLASAAVAAFAALAFALVNPGAGHAAPAKGPVISTASTSLGTILVDARGHTLYLFAKDKSGKSACAGACAAAWPPLIASGKPLAGMGAKLSLLGETKRGDGRMQVTYNHHPLYTFVKDTKKGQTSGENVDAFGAEWYAVSPAGAKVEPSGKTSAPAPANGGY